MSPAAKLPSQCFLSLRDRLDILSQFVVSAFRPRRLRQACLSPVERRYPRFVDNIRVTRAGKVLVNTLQVAVEGSRVYIHDSAMVVVSRSSYDEKTRWPLEEERTQQDWKPLDCAAIDSE